MLTPDTFEGMPRSRLHLEVTPNHTPPSPSVHSQITPGKGSSNNLHFNSQHYRTPSTHQVRAPHLKQFNSPQCNTPPGISIPHLTPRSTPRFQQLRRTPCSSNSSGSARSCRTPGMTPTEYIRNPFERNPESMAGWVFSPGVFTTKASSEAKTSPFWSIENLAMMRPADIDENTLKYVRSADSETEERAQRAIEDFFHKNDVIVPSPWSENGDKKKFHFLPQTPATPGAVEPIESSKASPRVSTKTGQREISCQTTLSLPWDFDLKNVLGKYYTQDREETSPELLSTSSLRRKLFSNGEVESSPSPVRENGRPRSLPMEADPSPTAETMCQTPESKRRSHPTPSSNLFSSSPIKCDSDREPHTPSLRRCSTAPDLMNSPELSPIGRQRPANTAAAKHTEEGRLGEGTPLCQPLQATPSSGRPSLPFNSPGVSPIRLEVSTIEDHPPGSVRHSWEDRRTKSLHVMLPTPPDLAADDSAISMKATETPSNNAKFLKDMEVDQDLSLNLDPFAASDGFKVLRGFNDFSESVVDVDPSHHPAHSTYVTQDTGYQTNSLQMTTHHDTGLHTNLTNPFASLLPLSGRDTGLEEDISESTSMDFNHIDPQTLFSSTRIPLSNPDDEMTRDVPPLPLYSPCNYKSEPMFKTTCFSQPLLDESLVRRQARKALGQLDANQMTLGSSPGKTKGIVSKDEHNCVTSQVVSQWKASVPTPLRQKMRQAGLIGDTTVDEQDLLPSTLASKALQRAGEDLDRYCGETIKTFRKPKKSIVFKEILTPDTIDLPPARASSYS